MMKLVKEYPDELVSVKGGTFEAQATQYLTNLLSNIRNGFPQMRLITLLRYLHPKNVAEALPELIFELDSLVTLDGAHFCNGFLAYKSFALSLNPRTLHRAVFQMWHPDKRATMAAAYSIISELLARICVLPASSAEVERVFSAMN